MDFFEAQDHARRQSQRLIYLFGLAVLSLILGTYTVVWLLFASENGSYPAGQPPFLQPDLLALVTLGLGIPIAGGTLFRTSQLRKGGAAVAELMGGRRVDPGTSDPRERVLMNVVEEMAIASGVPVPAVFVLDQESGINAFAAGHTLHDAAVAVTRGALEAFTRDELQGVMAHEFSHILNGDMRLNIRLMGLLFGILLLAVLGRILVRSSFGRKPRGRGGDREASAAMVIGIALVVLGYLGVWVGKLLQSAISRKREFLADAAAVQFTRNPHGIANALRRIGAAQHGSRIQDSHVDEAGHLFFARGAGRALTRLSATHPPLPVRIRRLDPAWDGTFTIPPAPSSSPPPSPPPLRTRTPGQAGSGHPGSPMEAGLLVGAILASAGTVMPNQLEEAKRRLSVLPEETRARIRTGEGAIEALLALALPATDTEATAAAEQEARERLGHGVVDGARGMQREPAFARPDLRLPLLELALPGLQLLPKERARALRALLADLLIHQSEGGGVPAFGFALVHMARRHLPEGSGDPGPSRWLGTTPRDEVLDEGRVLLSLLAWRGAGEGSAPAEAMAKEAFTAGWRLWSEGMPTGAAQMPVEMDLPEHLTLERVQTALERLERSAPAARRTLLEAAATVVAFDGELRVEEVELLRALSEAVEIPLPPLFLPPD
jgi:Zn-dependent protease with chaperone function